MTMAEYTYYLRNKATGETVDLGQTAELKEDVARKHGIVQATWGEHWQFGCRKV
jgi:hypothetical protein